MAGGMPSPGTGGSTSALQGYQQQYNLPLGGPSGPTQQEPYVYLGTTSTPQQTPKGVYDPHTGEYGIPKMVKSPITKTLSEMLSEFGKKSIDEQRRMAYKLALAGYVSGRGPKDAAEWAQGATLQEVLGAYSDFLQDAAQAAPNGVTPNQLLVRGIQFNVPGWDGKMSSLDDAVGKAGLTGFGSFEDPGKFTGTKTQKSTSFNFMDPTDAKMLAMNTLQRELGRDPTQGEYEDFISAIHAAEKRNPSVTTTQNTYAEGELTDSTSTTRGGVNADWVATQQARHNPDWAEWQAMGNYAPALFQALGAAVPGT